MTVLEIKAEIEKERQKIDDCKDYFFIYGHAKRIEELQKLLKDEKTTTK